MTKIIFVFTTCIALASAAFADQDNHKKKGQGQGQGQGQHHVNTGPKGHIGQVQGPHHVNTGPNVHKGNVGQGQGKVGHVNTGQNTHIHGAKVNKGTVQGNQKIKGQNFQANKGHGNKPNTTKFQNKHFNLANKPNPNIPKVAYKKNFHIQGANNWKGSKYVAFRNYHPVWHDRVWWTSHYSNHVVFVFGGWYYWNAGCWEPAWGYDPGAVYYYDGPIYASSPEVDPGQTVANVQSALQQLGYYDGDIDGILGPQTRAALASYQQDNGLYTTAAIDEPTLDSLGLS